MSPPGLLIGPGVIVIGLVVMILMQQLWLVPVLVLLATVITSMWIWTVQVDATGWGWHVGQDGRSGVVLRSGEALQVTRTGERIFVVTVNNPSAAAALLNTYADRNR